jgi:outer membrane murein-binding lipoprotein Lpp
VIRHVAAVTLGLGLLTGCSNDNVSCGLDQCTVSIDKTVNASVNVLGVEAKFVSADANTATLDVAGERVQLTTGQPAVDVAGLQVSLDGIDSDSVDVQISR